MILSTPFAYLKNDPIPCSIKLPIKTPTKFNSANTKINPPVVLRLGDSTLSAVRRIKPEITATTTRIAV